MLEETLEWRSTFKPEEILWVSSIHLVQSSRFPACHRTRSSTTVAFYLLQHEVAAEGATGKRLMEQTSMTAKEEQSLWWDQQNRFNCSTYSSSCLGFYLVLAVKNRVLILFGLQNTSSHDNQLRHLVDLLENAAEHQEQMMWLMDFTAWSLVNSLNSQEKLISGSSLNALFSSAGH